MLRFFGGCPDISLSGPKRHRFQDSRHRQALKEPHESYTRICSFEHLVHQSRLRDLRFSSPLLFPVEKRSPLSIVTASKSRKEFCVAVKHFSVAQIPVRFRFGRIWGLLRLEKRDYSQKPRSNRTSISRCIRLYETVT